MQFQNSEYCKLGSHGDKNLGFCGNISVLLVLVSKLHFDLLLPFPDNGKHVTVFHANPRCHNARQLL